MRCVRETDDSSGEREVGDATVAMRRQIQRNYIRLVNEVDPVRDVMDHLIQGGAVSIETKDRINAVQGSTAVSMT